MKVTVTHNLNVRVGKPSLNAPCYQYLAPGTVLKVDGKTYLGDNYYGIDTWYKDGADNYYWSGGVGMEDELNKTSSRDYAKHLIDLGIPKLWENHRQPGREIKVAVIDSGISSKCKAFEGLINLELSKEFSADIEDNNGHGTHIAGLISSKEINGRFCGINRDVELIILKTERNIVKQNKALVWCLEKGIDVINCSFESDLDYYRENVEKLVKNNRIIVAASGNWGTYGLSYPGAYKGVICVGEVDDEYNRINPKKSGDNMVVCAPGRDIFSLDNSQCHRFVKINDGSSQSTAIVSGIVALALGFYRNSQQRLPDNPLQWITNLFKTTSNNNFSGYKKLLHGFGIVNPQQIIELINNLN